MAEGISLVVLKTGETTGKEVSGIVESIKWEGRRGSPTRTITVTLLDDDGYGHERSGIDIEEGYHCIFSWNGNELFRGIFLRQTGTQLKKAQFKAYDLGIYLSNNRDTFCYEGKTATEIFKDVCTRFGIPYGTAAATKTIIEDLTKPKTTGWDAIADALSLEYDNTGDKFYVFAEKDELHLKRRTDAYLQWVLEVGENLVNYSYTVSLERIKTRIKLLSKEGTVLAQEQDDEAEMKYGSFQDVETPDESLTTAQLKELAKAMLETKKAPEKTLTLSNAIGIEDAISGVGVFIKIPRFGLRRSFYVDRDVHTFKGRMHTMNLTLNTAPETSESADADVEAAIDFLAGIGVLNSPDYWKAHFKDTQYVDLLLKKAAAAVTASGPRCSTVAEGTDALAAAGIVNTPGYWEAQTGNVGELVKALGGAAIASGLA